MCKAVGILSVYRQQQNDGPQCGDDHAGHQNGDHAKGLHKHAAHQIAHGAAKGVRGGDEGLALDHVGRSDLFLRFSKMLEVFLLVS